MYSIKLTRHEYDFVWPIVFYQRLYFFTANFSRFYTSMTYVHRLSIKYTKYYSSFVELRLRIYTSVYMYMRVRVKLTLKEPILLK